MPQNAMAVTSSVTTAGVQSPTLVDSGKRQVNTRATNSALNITTATVVKNSSSKLVNIIVLVAGSTAGAVYDSIATTGNSATNQIFAIPNTVGVYTLDFPVTNGIVVAPGTGQTIAISYS